MSLISSINPKLSAIWFSGILQVNVEKKKSSFVRNVSPVSFSPIIVLRELVNASHVFYTHRQTPPPSLPSFPGSFSPSSTTLHVMVYSVSLLIISCGLFLEIWSLKRWDSDVSLVCCPSPLLQGFTYVAPSVLENLKEKFSFEPKVRSPRKFPGSPRTPVR